MSGYIYILKSLKNNRFYTGSTNNIKRRLSQHQQGKSIYTQKIQLAFISQSHRTQNKTNEK